MIESVPFLCLGHRGACGHEPENTLRSIRRALELGANGIEIDVQLVGGHLWVFHDSRLERTTNGQGYLRRKSFEELRALDAGQGERIPFLREVLDEIRGRAILNIELKGRRTAAHVEAIIHEAVSRGEWDYGQFLVSSFLQLELRALKDRRIRRGLLLARPTRLFHLSARRVAAWSVHPALKFTTPKFVDAAHQRGWKVIPYTVNDPADLARMKELGVDGVFTDYPERVVNLFS